MKSKIIIFTDLDGTLLDKTKFHFRQAKKYINELISKNIIIIPISSKTEKEIRLFLREIKHNLPFVTENGSEIYNLNLLKKTFPRKITLARDKLKIYEIFNKKIDPQILENCEFVFKMTKRKQTKILGLKGKKLNASLHRKFTFPFIFRGSKFKKNKLLKDTNKMGLNILEGGRVMSLGDKIDKGYAVNKILKLTRNKLKSKIHTIAVGDNSNDLSMLNVSEYPCVIGNKNLKIKNKNKSFSSDYAPLGWKIAVKKAINKIEKRGLI